MHTQEPFFHKRVIHNITTLTLRVGGSRAHVDQERGLQLVQPQDLNHQFFLLLYIFQY